MAKLTAFLVGTFLLLVLAYSELASGFSPLIDWLGPVFGVPLQFLLGLIFMMVGNPVAYPSVLISWVLVGIIIGLLVRRTGGAILSAFLAYVAGWLFLILTGVMVFFRLFPNGLASLSSLSTGVSVPPAPPGTDIATILHEPLLNGLPSLFAAATSGGGALNSISSDWISILFSWVANFVLLLFTAGATGLLVRKSSAKLWHIILAKRLGGGGFAKENNLPKQLFLRRGQGLLLASILIGGLVIASIPLTSASAAALPTISPIQTVCPTSDGNSCFPLTCSTSSNMSMVGLTQPFAGAHPPDSQIAVGPNDIVEMVNVQGEIWTKQGVSLCIFALSDFFSSPICLAPPCLSDPRILYDSQSGRWFATDSAFTDNAVRLAVSTSSDPTGTWNVYSVPFSAKCPDQPSLGESDDKLAISANDYSSCGAFDSVGIPVGSEFVIINKAQLVAGGSATYESFGSNGQYTIYSSIHPAQSLTSSATLYMVSTPIGICEGCGSSSSVTLWQVTGVPGVTAVAVNSKSVSIKAWRQNVGAEQPGTTVLLDTGDWRVQDAAWYKNSLWFAFDDGCVPSGDTPNVIYSCFRLVEIDTTVTTATQDFDFGTTGMYFFYPALRVDAAGNLDVVFGYSSSTQYPGLALTGQGQGDSTGTLQTPKFLTFKNAGSITNADSDSFCTNCARYGDYFGAAVDPSNPETIWTAGEYVVGQGCVLGVCAYYWATSINSSGFPKITTSLFSSTITVRSSVTDSATLSGVTNNAAGSVTYEYFSGSSCSGIATTVGSQVSVTKGNVRNSISTTFGTVGSYSWKALYSGDSDNSPATSECESLAVTGNSQPYYLEATLGEVNPDGSATSFYSFLTNTATQNKLFNPNSGEAFMLMFSQSGGLTLLPSSLTNSFSNYAAFIPQTMVFLAYTSDCADSQTQANQAVASIATVIQAPDLSLIVSFPLYSIETSIGPNSSACGFVYGSGTPLRTIGPAVASEVLPSISETGLINILKDGLTSGNLIPGQTPTSVNATVLVAGFGSAPALSNSLQFVLPYNEASIPSPTGLIGFAGAVTLRLGVVHSSSSIHDVSLGELLDYQQNISFANSSTLSVAGIGIPPPGSSPSSWTDLGPTDQLVLYTNNPSAASSYGSMSSSNLLYSGQSLPASSIHVTFTGVFPANLRVSKSLTQTDDGNVQVNVSVRNLDTSPVTLVSEDDSAFLNSYSSGANLMSGTPTNASSMTLAPNSTIAYKYTIRLTGFGSYDSTPATVNYLLNGTSFTAESNAAVWQQTSPSAPQAITGLLGFVAGVTNNEVGTTRSAPIVGSVIVHAPLLLLIGLAARSEYRSFRGWGRVDPETARKLEGLKRMLDSGLITKKDFEEQRRRIMTSR